MLNAMNERGTEGRQILNTMEKAYNPQILRSFLLGLSHGQCLTLIAIRIVQDFRCILSRYKRT